MMRNNQSGNALVIILITIVLLAALAMTFSRSTEQGAGSMNKQQARIAAQDILSFAQAMQNAIDKLRHRGCSESEFDLENNVWLRVDNTAGFPPGDNAGAPTDGSCSIFKDQGAKLTPVAVPLQYTDTKGQTLNPTGFAPGSFIVSLLNIPWLKNGTSRADVTFHAIFLNDDICLKINELLGVPNNGSSPPTATSVGGSRYRSISMSTALTITDVSGQITGHSAFCIRGEDSLNRLIYTLLAR